MLRNDRLSEDVIKIFHNAKGSVRNNISKWTENATAETKSAYELKSTQRRNYDASPFDHAAGEYEPLPREHTHPSIAEVHNDSIKKDAIKIKAQSKVEMDELINDQ